MVTYTNTSYRSPRTVNKSPGLTRGKQLVTFFLSLLLLSTAAFSQVDDFNQAQNDQNGAGAPYNISWVNGILNATHTAYFEGVGIPQRLIFTNIPATTGNVHTLKFEHLTVAGGKHAYDFLMSWQQAQETAGDHGNGTVNELQRLFTDQCAGAASADGLATCSALSGFSFTDDPNALNSRYRRPLLPDMTDPSIGGNVQAKINCFEGIYGNRYIEIFGNQNISNASITFDGYKPGTDLAQYTITWTSASDKIMIRFAGRAAKGPGSCGYGSGLGAGSISGGNYHFKLSSIDGTQTGSQDNQLMAGAIPEPPDCGIEPGELACPNTPSLTFNYTGSTTGVSLVWSFLSNTANAVIQNTTANPTVTIVPGPGGFTPGGSFQLHLAVTKDGVTTECDQTTASVIQDVDVTASASPTLIDLAASSTSQLNATVSLNGVTLTNAQADADFNFSWSQDPTTGGSLSATNIRNPIFTASAAGIYTFTVTATQKAAPFCSNTATVQVRVAAQAGCPVISQLTLCANTSGSLTATTGEAGNAIPPNTHYTWSILTPNGGASITSSDVTDVTSINVQAGTTNFTVRLTVSYDNTAIASINCDRVVQVNPIATVEAGGPDTRCQSTSAQTITLTGASVGGGATTGAWSVQSSTPAGVSDANLSSTAQTSNPAAVILTIPANYYGVVVLRLTTNNPDGPCEAVYEDRTITINQAATVEAGGPNTVCKSTSAQTITLTGATVGGGATTGAWSVYSSTPAGVTNANLSSTAQTNNPAAVTLSIPANYSGVVVLRLTTNDPEGSCEAVYDDRTINVNLDASAEAGGPNTVCQSPTAQTITLSGATVGGGATTGAWSVYSSTPAGVTNANLSSTAQTADYDDVTLTIPANYYGVVVLRLTTNDPEGPCGAVYDDRTITINQAATVEAGGPNTVCQSTSAQTITLTGATVGGGATTGAWSVYSSTPAGVTNANLSSTAQTNNPAAVTLSIPANYYGVVVLRLTTNNPDGPCEAVYDDRTINVTQLPACSIGGNREVCNGTSNVYTAPAGMDAYSWSFVGATNGAQFDGATNGQTVTVIAGTGNYTLKLVVTDNNCSSECTAEVVVNNCDVLCTYTQGAYGNEGGKHCTGEEGAPLLTTAETITSAISSYTTTSYTPPLSGVSPFVNGVLVLGKAGGRSVTITASAADVAKVIEYLPGGGSSYAFTHNNNLTIGSGDFRTRYTKATGGGNNVKYNINNTLLAQTMTLGINLGVKDNLRGFTLQANKYLVTADVEECGSNEIKDCQWTWNATTSQWVLTSTPYEAFAPIPQALYDAISPKTVGGLFTYANNALAGDALASGVTLNMIASAVDMINNAFDGCRSFVAWESVVNLTSYCQPPMYTGTRISSEVTTEAASSDLKVAAYPNPFNNAISFNFTSPVSGKALLEVYDLVGRRLAVVFEGQVDAGMQKAVNYNVPSAQRIPMIYRLSIGGKTSFGKLLPGHTD